MAHTINVNLEIKIRKPSREEAEDLCIDYDDVKDFDPEIVDAQEMSELINSYLEHCLGEFSMEILSGSDFPAYISKITASPDVPQQKDGS